MKKPTVGILSMQRVINYGSFLQAYALKQLLKRSGAGDIYFIDIVPGKILVNNMYTGHRLIRYSKKLFNLIKSKKLISGLKTYLYNRRLTKTIVSSWPLLDLQSKPTEPLDLAVIGSDEVFNCCQAVSWGYSTQLFGDIPKNIAREVISYAGSFGYTNLDMLKSYNIDSEVASNLKKLHSISVRDKNSFLIVQSLTGIAPMIHVDPVLAYGYEDEIAGFKDSPYSKPYMIVYSYQDRICDTEEIASIIKYAKDNKLKLVSIFCRYDWCDTVVIPGTPLEVLRWFKFSDSIVTDTFHGTIFSIITRSKFVSLLRSSNNNKLSFLLKQLGLSNRASSALEINSTLSLVPNYDTCNLILSEKREESQNYLDGNLKRLYSSSLNNEEA